MATNQGCKGLVPGPRVACKFLYHYLSSIVETLDGLGTGATFRELSGSKLKEVGLPLPPLPEQRRIVAILDEAFEAIAKAKANTERNLENAREAFEAERESIFDHGSARWRWRPLGEIGSTQTGSTPPSSQPDSYGDFLPFIKPGDFRLDGGLDYENSGLSEHGAAGARIVPPGSVLMVCIGATIGKAGFTDRRVATNQQINAWTPMAGALAKFIYYQMTTVSFQARVRLNSGQATLPIINKGKWSQLAVLLPDTLEEQVAATRRLDRIQLETSRLTSPYEQKLTALDELKQSLLHQAFTGALTSKSTDQQLQAVA